MPRFAPSFSHIRHHARAPLSMICRHAVLATSVGPFQLSPVPFALFPLFGSSGIGKFVNRVLSRSMLLRLHFCFLSSGLFFWVVCRSSLHVLFSSYLPWNRTPNGLCITGSQPAGRARSSHRLELWEWNELEHLNGFSATDQRSSGPLGSRLRAIRSRLRHLRTFADRLFLTVACFRCSIELAL